MGRPKVLIVDDDAMVLRVLCDCLESDQYDIVSALDGSGAIRALTDFGSEIRLLITDFMMPGIDGIQLSSFATDKLNPKLRTLVLSGMPPIEGWEDRTIMKPYALGELRQRIAEELAKAQADASG